MEDGNQLMKGSGKDFYVLIVSATLLHVSNLVIMPVFPLYILDKGASALELGLIISLQPLFTIFSKFFLSFLIDRSGRWPIIPVSMIGQSLGMLLYSIAPSLIWLYPIRIFQTVGFALFTPAAISIIYELSPSGKRGDFVGRYLTSYGAASMIGPLICSILCEYKVSYSGVFLFSSALSFIGVVLFLILIPMRRVKDYRVSNETSKKSIGSSEAFRMLRGLLFSRSGSVLGYVRIAFSLANSFITTIFAVYLSESLFYSPSIIALLFAVKGVTNMFFRIPSGMLSDRVGRIKPLFLAYSLLAVTFFLISELKDFKFLLLVMAIYGLSHAMRAVSEWALLGDITPREISGLSTAYLSLMFDVGRGVGSLFAGATLMLLGAGTIFKIGSMILASALAVIPTLKKRKP